MGGSKRHDCGTRLLSRRSDQAIDAARQHPIALIGGVLVAKSGPLGGVAKSAHDLLRVRSGGGGERPSVFAQVVQMQVSKAQGPVRSVPLPLPHADPERSAL